MDNMITTDMLVKVLCLICIVSMGIGMCLGTWICDSAIKHCLNEKHKLRIYRYELYCDAAEPWEEDVMPDECNEENCKKWGIPQIVFSEQSALLIKGADVAAHSPQQARRKARRLIKRYKRMAHIGKAV